MAALAGTLPPQNSYCGPFKSASQNDTAEYWVLVRDAADNTLVSAWWASDPTGATPWTEITLNQPDFVAEIASMNAWQVDNKLYVVAQNTSDDVYFARLDMDQDTRAWEAVTGGVHEVELLSNNAGTTVANACDLTVESDGSTMHVFYQADTVKVMGTEQERIHHLRSDNADTASVTVASSGNNVFGTPASDQFDWSGPRCVMGASDRTHVLGLSGDTGTLIWENDVTTGGTPGTPASTGEAAAAQTYPLGHGVTVNRAGTIKCRIPYIELTTNDVEAEAWDSGAAPTFGTQNVSTQNPDVVNGSAGLCLAALGSAIYAAFADDTDNDVDIENDADSDTWSGTVTSITTTASQVHLNCYDTEATTSTTGPVMAYLYDSDGAGGTPLYGETAITVSTASLNDVDMGPSHSYHGPYEI